MRPANERQCYIVTSSLIGWAHTQNTPRKGLSLKNGGNFHRPYDSVKRALTAPLKTWMADGQPCHAIHVALQ